LRSKVAVHPRGNAGAAQPGFRGCLVAKNRNPEDGRGIDVQITEAGLNRLRDAYPIHLASVRYRIMDQIESKDLSCFCDVTAAIVRGIEESQQDR
jgi:DNA-binding MarR family transcriptional regulator